MKSSQGPARCRPIDVARALAILRVAMGVNLVLHGAQRLPELRRFAAGVSLEFGHSFLPPALVNAWALAIPGIEVVLGLLLIAGLALRAALVVAGIYMGILIAGQVTIGGYPAVLEEQMYALIFAALLVGNGYERYTVDDRRKRQRHDPGINEIF